MVAAECTDTGGAKANVVWETVARKQTSVMVRLFLVLLLSTMVLLLFDWGRWFVDFFRL